MSRKHLYEAANKIEKMMKDAGDEPRGEHVKVAESGNFILLGASTSYGKGRFLSETCMSEGWYYRNELVLFEDTVSTDKGAHMYKEEVDG